MSLYTAKDQSNVKGLMELSPTSPGIDVLRDFAWTANPENARREVPALKLTEFKLTRSQLLTQTVYHLRSIADAVGANEVTGKAVKKLDAAAAEIGVNVNLGEKFGELAANTSTNPYFGLYAGEETGFVYNIPYLSNDYWQTSVGNWGQVEMKTDILPVDIALGAVASLAKKDDILDRFRAPGVATEIPKTFKPTTEGQTTNVQLVLYNTQTFEDVINNWELCFVLTHQNLYGRTSIDTIDVPSVYKYAISGLKAMGAAVLQNLKIQSLGKTRTLIFPDGKKRLIPDAYHISFSLVDLLPYSRNFHSFLISGDEDKVQVITDTADSPTVSVDPNTYIGSQTLQGDVPDVASQQ